RAGGASRSRLALSTPPEDRASVNLCAAARHVARGVVVEHGLRSRVAVHAEADLHIVAVEQQIDGDRATRDQRRSCNVCAGAREVLRIVEVDHAEDADRLGEPLVDLLRRMALETAPDVDGLT